MRVLLLHDGLWDDGGWDGADRDADDRPDHPVAERSMRDLARSLSAADCEVRCLPGPSDVERDTARQCSTSLANYETPDGTGLPDPPTDFPTLMSSQSCAGDFLRLSDTAIAAYRHWLRRLLDRAVDEFVPDVIHASHIWLPGHLALESGVPYVLSTWGAELTVYQADARFRPLIEQAAENASRIVADSEATRERVLAAFDLDTTVVTTPRPDNLPGSPLAWLTDIYQRAIDSRRTASPPRL